MEWVTDTIYNRRIRWAGGFKEKGNGFEIWRRMHKEYHGSGDGIMLSGLKLLHEYPKHDKVEGLAAHLDGWENLLDEYGTGLQTHSPHMLRPMLVDIIPTSFDDDIITRPEIKTDVQILEYCRN